jgi:glycopeptide antibiotics resistance protein
MTLETVGIIIGGLIFALIPFGMLIYCIVKELTEKKLWGYLLFIVIMIILFLTKSSIETS